MKQLFQIIKNIIEVVIKKRIYLLTTLVILIIGYILILKGSLNIDKNVSNIYISIGTSLIATGIVATLDLFRELVRENNFKKMNNVIYEAGIWSVHKKRDLDAYDVLMEGMEKGVDITGYSLRSFFDSYEQVIKKKIKQNPLIKIRMLVVDPESEFSKNREKIEGNYTGSVFKNNIEKIERELLDIDNVEIKKISTPLTTMIFRIDNVMFVGPHLYKKSSKATLTLEISKNGWLFEQYQEEFERLWNDAK